MKIKVIAKFSASNLAHRGLRSWLTVLGIVIGVAAVMSIMSLGQGMQQSFDQQVDTLDSRIVTVSPGSNSGMGGGPPGFGSSSSSEDSPKLGRIDYQTVSAVPAVEYTNGIVSGDAEVTYLTEEASVSVEGVDPLAWKEMTSATLQKGRWLSTSDTGSIVITQSLAEDTFDREINLNSQVTIGGNSFKVVGIVESSDTGFGFGGSGTVYMNSETARTVIEDLELSQNQYSSIEAYVEDDASLNQTVQEIKDDLMIARNIVEEDEQDFTVSSEASQSRQQTLQSLTQSLSLFIAGIAGISLLVGAIGIANTMYMSVMERTKQIGTLKAIGATRKEIMAIFMFESAAIGLVGGLIGIFLGFTVSGLISGVAGSFLGQGSVGTVVTPQLVILSLGFAVLTGVISGVFPARKAAQLEPVEALRAE